MAWEWGYANYAQWKGSTELAELRQSSVEELTEGALFGRLEIPKLNLSAIVFEGVETKTLAKGVGRLRNGGKNNLVLAAHRDTFFRPLKNVQVGESIEFSTPSGRKTYRVTGTSVVEPSDTRVLEESAAPKLTLITCYPFSYLGSAPLRFIVTAALDKTK